MSDSREWEKLGEHLAAAFDAWRNPPQRWEGSIHMSWGAITPQVIEICRRPRKTSDLIGDVIRDLEAAGFRAYYDHLSRCFEVIAPPADTCETAEDFLERVTGISGPPMSTATASELATIAAETLRGLE